ncbi:YdcF family protein [Corynebacterium liangguodongii]|uniref:YdcF family protein n=1 Tax=Corynebacterium liangguodongii TaxID=2079535 RepID=A0A2S0WDQ9_9CORY|nr:YdcF family protein [Corynebacterium liangguodongii]AWB83915.1 YdcF family protein [Corynebacterium liangguodongii]PWB99054.1 YdcF family protein [Corynebacterium liangguodongii]
MESLIFHGVRKRRAIASLCAALVLAVAPASPAHAGGVEDAFNQMSSSIVTGLKMSPLGLAAAHAALLDPHVPIIVLGARLDPGCSAPAVLDDRLATATVLAHLHPANPVVVTGGYTQPGCQAEGEYMRDKLVSSWVNPSRIIVDTTAGSTVGNAQATARYAGSVAGIAQAGVLVTSPNHAPRAMDTFADVEKSALWLVVPSTVN